MSGRDRGAVLPVSKNPLKSLGHPANGKYHYHYFSKATSAYDGCLMSCQHDVASNIVGVMLDGFPLYGPMQYFSPSEGKIYLKPGLVSRIFVSNQTISGKNF